MTDKTPEWAKCTSPELALQGGESLAFHIYGLEPDQKGRIWCHGCLDNIATKAVVVEVQARPPLVYIRCGPCADRVGVEP